MEAFNFPYFFVIELSQKNKFLNFNIKVCINLSFHPQISTESAEALNPKKKFRRIIMLRKIVSVLAIGPLALNLIATAPTIAGHSNNRQQPTNAFELSCNQLIFDGASFHTRATYPGDSNVYTGPLRITHVHNSKRHSRWSGVLNLDNRNENVSGQISGNRFTLRRKSGQNWSATCTVNGILGSFKKDGLRPVGSFVLRPGVAHR